MKGVVGDVEPLPMTLLVTGMRFAPVGATQTATEGIKPVAFAILSEVILTLEENGSRLDPELKTPVLE